MSYHRAYNAYDNSTSLFNSTNTYDGITGISNIRTNLLVEEVDSLKRIVKELSQSIDSIHEKLEKNQPGEGNEEDNSIDRNENREDNEDNEKNENNEKNEKTKNNEKNEKKKEKRWQTVLSGIKNRAFYYGMVGASICALYFSRKLLPSFTSKKY